MSVLVLVVTGFAWQGVDSLRSNLSMAAGLGLGGAKDGAIDILMVGTDSRTDAHGNPLSESELASLRAGDEVASNTDTIVLIRIPNDGSSATAISIPRDSYVDVPGIGMSKINAAYGATKETERLKLVNEGESDADADADSTKAGRQALIKSVADLTGVTVDHYAEVGLLGFVLLTNAVGGVDVCLNNAVDEPMSGANFPAGEQTLQGSDALSFVRQRHELPRGDLDRIVRQQVFMASLARKVLSAKTLSSPSKLSELSTAISRSVVLDSDWDILKFAGQLQELAGGEVKFETIPVTDLNGNTDDGESVVTVDPAAVKKYVASLAGEDADTSSQTTTAKPKPTVNPSSVTVDVANDSGIDGLASNVSQALTTDGYGTGTVGNNTGNSVDNSQVLAASADDAGAKAVADKLGGLRVAADSSVPKGTVRVVLAADYAGPGSDSYTGPTTTSDSESTDPQSDSSQSSTAPTPVPPAPPIDAGEGGPKCVN
ncbi:LCP family protein [Antrihabitans cavernicola]|uniref:LytR family transcriptional regulator n=1 Tax=Antrihabitans cavernicola TaxID=2495913 RepID=A0A5A7SIN7_9NOCA|nr:LCP family protein [Spelaeibacter cavernicola]KAA0024345.1 LytR family transcriptional regulator [Spelaeibacter cavernicola]